MSNAAEKSLRRTDHPEVFYTDLIPDDCNFKDKTFETFVDRFMERFMPGGPMDLLETEGEDAMEKWHIEPGAHHETEQVSWTTWHCPKCESTDLEEGEECCFVDHEDDPEEPPIPLVGASSSGWAIRNGDTGELVRDDCGYVSSSDLAWQNSPDHEIDLEDESYVFIWDEEPDEELVQLCDERYEAESGHERRYGFPWANGWFFMPDSRITDEHLEAAGFVVATYKEDNRLCGIDGGGYDMKGAHFAKLCAVVSDDRDWSVETDQGTAYVTFQKRSDLEKLAATSTVGNIDK